MVFFMANKQNEESHDSPLEQLVSLVNKISGKQPNLQVNVQDLKLNLGDTKFNINGQVNVEFVKTTQPKRLS